MGKGIYHISSTEPLILQTLYVNKFNIQTRCHLIGLSTIGRRPSREKKRKKEKKPLYNARTWAGSCSKRKLRDKGKEAIYIP